MPSSGRIEVTVSRVKHRDTYARVTSAGQRGERAFVLVPGIGVSSTYFERLALELNEFGPVLALDLPGFGGVPHPKHRRMRIADYADLVEAVIADQDLDDPVVVGHSMGSQIVAELAATRCRDGRPLTDVVLISPVINRHERRRRTAALRFLQSARHEPPKVAVIALYGYLLCGPRWFSRMLPALMSYPIERTLPDITSETLVLTGEEDRLCPRPWVQEVADLLPKAQVYAIAGAAHSVMHANAADVGRLCVRQARREQLDDNHVREVSHPSEDEPDAPDVKTAVQAVRGRVDEVVGIVTGQDDVIAAGKTAHMQAQQRTDEAAEGKSASGADSPEQ